MHQVELKFSTRVPPKATADCHSGGGPPRFFCLFMYANEWLDKSHCWNGDQQWWSLPITILVVAATANAVLAVPPPPTQAQVVNSNSTLAGKETHWL